MARFLKAINIRVWEIIFFLLLSGIVYALNIDHFSLYRDDWYYAYDGFVAGPSIFHQMFSIDRPARGYFFEIFAILFDSHVIFYHLAAWLWRTLGGFGALWLFRLLWPRQRAATFIAAVLFLSYPGYLWWVAGIEYQPMIASACLHVFSIAMTLKAVQASRWQYRLIWMTGGILTGWGALGLVDYAIGMEAFRILAILLIVSRSMPETGWGARLRQAFRTSLLPLVIPIGFLVWKIFLFEGDRKATDIRLQLFNFLRSPVDAVLLWAVHLFQSVLNVTILAWGVPLYQYFFSLPQADRLSGLLVSLVVIAIFVVSVSMLQSSTAAGETDTHSANGTIPWEQEAIWLGLGGVIAGVLPVVLANRYVSFQAYSHYALPASLGAAVFLAGCIYSLDSRRVRVFLATFLIGVSALTHQAVSVAAVREQAEIRDFWWQVYWRIPSIQAGTTLAVDYAAVKYGEDTDIVWGPANFLYYPEQNPGATLVKYKLAATSLTQDGILKVVMGDVRATQSYRSHSMFLNYRRVLVISQPFEGSCVHVSDERWPERSNYDSAQITAMASHSKIENVLLDETTPVPMYFAFGPEPAHDWCYYYQKASLARQAGDWETLAALGDEAAIAGYSPEDPIEWMPYLQAYAYFGNTKAVESISSKLSTTDFYRLQICQLPSVMDDNGYPLSPEMTGLFDSLYCQPKK
jgi:hypothetical protein